MTGGELICTGLDGTNPMGFLAGLGVISVCDRMMREARPTLRWTEGFDVHAVLGGVGGLDAVVDAVMADMQVWRTSPALHFDAGDGPISDVKFASNDEVRAYLKACDEAGDGGRSIGLATALVAEFVVAGTGDMKPTPFHFTAGQQLFVKMARELLDSPSLTVEAFTNSLVGEWSRDLKVKTFRWDTTAERLHALLGRRPSDDKRGNVPGAEWLALMGLSLFPFLRPPGSRRGSVSGLSRSDGEAFSWPLWADGLRIASVRSLLASPPSLVAGGVTTRLRSRVHREGKGYGSFRPPSRVQL